ncbi:MAG: HDOD domain-containing protein [Ruminococcus sp.]|jgi:EAL and modified HD-GYP domain-containing signal transduction protein|nr:HDOD domain-containing protein [Ruminococcus sp.]
MESFIVRQAILDDRQKTVGYEIIYNEHLGADTQISDATAANAIEEFLSNSATDTFLDGKPAFLTFTTGLLEKNIPKMFAQSKLILQIEDSLITNPASHKLITKYYQQGYKFAVCDFEFAPRFFGVLDVVNYIKVNFRDFKSQTLNNVISIGNSFGKNVIAYNIECQEAYDKAVACGCRYFQGPFVSEKLPATIKKTNYLQSNFFLLMCAITKDEPDIDEIESIVSRDVSLTFSLLRLVNSAYFALRNRARSVKQALVILGLGQLKQWIYLLSFKQEDGSMPDELLKVSFLRATFASELLPLCKDMPISKSEAYLLGMFSTLGKLMQCDLALALDQLPIVDEIKNALLYQTGRTGQLFKLIISYEKADWKTMQECAEDLSIPQNAIATKYFDCVENVNSIWNSLSRPNELAE